MRSSQKIHEKLIIKYVQVFTLNADDFLAGRASSEDKAASDNGYFDCKVKFSNKILAYF
jgi:hypothetical protein